MGLDLETLNSVCGVGDHKCFYDPKILRAWTGKIQAPASLVLESEIVLLWSRVRKYKK